jgi:hypothetical protein
MSFIDTVKGALPDYARLIRVRRKLLLVLIAVK